MDDQHSERISQRIAYNVCNIRGKKHVSYTFAIWVQEASESQSKHAKVGPENEMR